MPGFLRARHARAQRDPGHTNLQEALTEADMAPQDQLHLQPPGPEVRYVFTPTPVPPG
jgi:hypothetical protein